MERYYVSKFDDKTFAVCDNRTNTRACMCFSSPVDGFNAEIRAFIIAAVLNYDAKGYKPREYMGRCPDCDGETKLIKRNGNDQTRRCTECKRHFTVGAYIKA